jgi:hypothetical protein
VTDPATQGTETIALANDKRTLRRLRRVRKSITAPTLTIWRRDKCVHLEGRKLKSVPWRPTKEYARPLPWNFESDILLIEQSLRDLEEHCYRVNGRPAYTSVGAADNAECAKGTIKELERAGLLEGHTVRSKAGLGQTVQVYEPIAVAQAIEEWQNKAAQRAAFDNTYDDGSRVNIVGGAMLLGVSRRYFDALVQNATGELKQVLGPDSRERPSGREEITVLIEGVHKLLRDRRKAIKAAKRLKRAGWGISSDVDEKYRRPGKEIYPILRAMRAEGTDSAQEHWWPVKPDHWKTNNGRKCRPYRLRWLWVYNLARFDELWRAARENRAANPATATRQNESPKKRTREHDPQTMKVYRFCYVEYRLNGRTRSDVQKEAFGLFGYPKEEAHVTIFADRYARYKELPAHPSQTEATNLLASMPSDDTNS